MLELAVSKPVGPRSCLSVWPTLAGAVAIANAVPAIVGMMLLFAACTPAAAPHAGAGRSEVQPSGTAAERDDRRPVARRPFEPLVAGQPVRTGIGYGPYRAAQRPGGAQPTRAQILEDLRLIAGRWQLIRIYSSRGPAEDILQTLREHDLPLRAMLGAWIAPEAEEENAAELTTAIRLANSFPEQVVAVSVGNETQVAWSAHRSPREALIESIRKVRNAIQQPVTTADDYNFWNKPESHAVAEEVDFVTLHAYAMWNRQQLEGALDWTRRTLAAIEREHPGLTIVLGETGWATELNPDGDEVQHIKATAGEAEQAAFFAAFSSWTREARLLSFYFEAFDEPWKGGSDPRDVEKHWGLYRVDRTPKAALIEARP